MTYKINVGDRAPTFTAIDHEGQKFNSNKLRGSKAIIYFYPKDDTPGCTKEACSFRDRMLDLTKLGVSVIGISPDNAQSHQAFIEKYQLNFALLTDENKEICHKFDVLKEKEAAGKKILGVERSTFIIDADGIIQWIERQVDVEGHTERVLKALQIELVP